jgi:hypothetical protein
VSAKTVDEGALGHMAGHWQNIDAIAHGEKPGSAFNHPRIDIGSVDRRRELPF